MVGIWFYDEPDCDRISALLQRIAATFGAPAEAPAGGAVRAAARPAAAVGVPGLPLPQLQHSLQSCSTSRSSPPVQEAAPAPQPVAVAQPAAEPPAGGNGGDAGFWDKRVAVPAGDAGGAALRQLQPADGSYAQSPVLLVPAQLQQPAAPAEPAGGSSNDLARLFAGMKTAPSAAAPAAAPAATPPTAAPLALLTPEALQQEATSAPAPEAEPAGSMLLQSLLRGAQPPAPRPVDISGARPCPWRCIALHWRAASRAGGAPRLLKPACPHQSCCCPCRGRRPCAAEQGVVAAVGPGGQRGVLRHAGNGAEAGGPGVRGGGAAARSSRPCVLPALLQELVISNEAVVTGRMEWTDEHT